jgi:hypothetical protein
MTQITLDIPDELISSLKVKNQSLEDIVINTLKNYIETETTDITKTQTWELCGSLEIPNPETEFIIDNKKTEISTNYAENVDKILYS